MADKPAGGGSGTKGVDAMALLKAGGVVLVIYILIGPAATSRLLSGNIGTGELALLVSKVSGAGVAIGLILLPFPELHAKGRHIIFWSLAAGVLLLTLKVWFPAAQSLFEHLIMLLNGLVPPAPAVPPAGP